VLALEWSYQASDDLEEIRDYIEQRNPLAAQALYETIKGGAERLTSIPYAFRSGRIVGTREHLVHPNYLLVYKVTTTYIKILRVMHAKRKYP